MDYIDFFENTPNQDRIFDISEEDLEVTKEIYLENEEFNNFFSSHLAAEEATTLGGYLFEKLGVVPVKGAVLNTEPFDFVIQDMVRQRIHQVTVRRKP